VGRTTIAALTEIGAILSTPAAAIGLSLAAIAAYLLEPDPYTHSWCRRIRKMCTQRWVRSQRRPIIKGAPLPTIPLSCNNVRSPSYDPRMLGGGAVVPYVGSWSEEELLPAKVVQRPIGGIGYADESAVDRDEWGVLWTRMASRVGAGRPLFTKLHPLRQRRAMRRLLCQVCGRPADRTDQGLLWLVPGADTDRLEGMAMIQPPLCMACAQVSIGACPALRAGCVAVRARTRLCGVTGVRFQPGRPFPTLADDEDEVVGFDDPAILWMQATQLARSLYDCTPVDVESL
jgi:hypothetical protein